MVDNRPTVMRIIKDEATARNGMVATKDRLATRAGVQILEAGGNAIDAAVAACFAVGVVEPGSSGIGGGGYMVYQVGEKGGVIGFPMRGPLTATPDMYELTGQSGVGSFFWPGVIGNENLEGYRSIATPGAVAGLCLAHEGLGLLPLREVVAPAVHLAREGFAPGWFTLYAHGLQVDKLLKYGELRRIFLPDGTMPIGGATSPPNLRQPELADVLEAIGREGPEAFYRGDVARAIAGDIQANGGILSERDLAQYKPFQWERGLEISYHGHTVRFPPYACAGTTSAMTLKMLDGFDVVGLGHNSVEMLHTYISSARLAYADRFEYMGDPDFVDVPWAGMLSDEYAERRRASIGDRALEKYFPGDPWIEEGRRPDVVLGASIPEEETGKTHLCTMDGDGNAVSLTNTVGAGFGSGVVPRGTGIVMNDGMVWWDPVPGHVNSIGPGKLPLNNMTPALVMDENGVKMAVGASGGRRITNCVTQLIIKSVDFDMRPQESIDSPRVDCSTPHTSVDLRLDESVQHGLEGKGHRLVVIGEDFIKSDFASFASPLVITRAGDGLFRAGVDTFHSAHAEGP